MAKFNDRDSLTKAFQQLGNSLEVSQRRADEQLRTKQPILERESFLRIVNSFVFPKNPDRLLYVHDLSEEELEENPFAQAVKRILGSGADIADLGFVIRELQYELLDSVFSLLDTVSDYDDFPVDEFNVYAIDESTNEPKDLIDGLHEDIGTMMNW
jgi:hypothetical protein